MLSVFDEAGSKYFCDFEVCEVCLVTAGLFSMIFDGYCAWANAEKENLFFFSFVLYRQFCLSVACGFSANKMIRHHALIVSR